MMLRNFCSVEVLVKVFWGSITIQLAWFSVSPWKFTPGHCDTQNMDQGGVFMCVPGTWEAVPFKVYKPHFRALLNQHTPVFAFILLILYFSFYGILKPKVRAPVDISMPSILGRVSAKGSKKRRAEIQVEILLRYDLVWCPFSFWWIL